MIIQRSNLCNRYLSSLQVKQRVRACKQRADNIHSAQLTLLSERIERFYLLLIFPKKFRLPLDAVDQKFVYVNVLESF